MSETDRAWVSSRDRLPPENITVETKIDDANGVRNKQLLYRQGRLWYFPDGSMYVYYTPTHWRHLAPDLTAPF